MNKTTRVSNNIMYTATVIRYFLIQTTNINGCTLEAMLEGRDWVDFRLY